MDELLTQLTNISKSHAYDILAKQVQELKGIIREQNEALEEVVGCYETTAKTYLKEHRVKYDPQDFESILKARTIINKAKIASSQ